MERWSSQHQVARVDPRRDLIRHVQFGASDLLVSLGHPVLEHNLEGPYSLERRGYDPAGLLGFDLKGFEALLLDGDLDFAPIEYSLEVAQQRHRQSYSKRGPLRSVDLTDDHPHSRSGRVAKFQLLLNRAQMFRQHLTFQVKPTLPLFQGNFERRIWVMPHLVHLFVGDRFQHRQRLGDIGRAIWSLAQELLDVRV